MSDWKDACSAAVVALGNNRLRMQMQQRLIAAGLSIATIVHPSAQVSRYAKIGAGTVLLANSVVGADVKLGDAVIINTAATVDHDCVLGDGVHLAPGSHLGGGVTVGNQTWIGIGCTIKHGIKIGENAAVDPGSVIISDIETS